MAKNTNKVILKKVLEHPDKSELLSKLLIGISSKDIRDWLAAKYTSPAEKKFVLSEKSLDIFKDNYLDLYNTIKEDLTNTKSSLSLDEELQLTLQDNTIYKSKMIELATGELDIRKMLGNMIIAIETRAAQIFDEIQQDPRNINTRNERLLIEYFDKLGANYILKQLKEKMS